ncbi:MAG: Gfo/Idh/MocA family oxidoreductase [Chloroflexota bacterium]
MTHSSWPGSTLTAAVIGGGLGGRLSLDALVASDRYVLIGIADVNAEVRAALADRYPGIPTFESHEQLLRSASPDVICVSTHPHSHEEVALAAVAASPRGMLVEKPLGPTSATGARIIDAIRGAGIPVVVPHGLVVQATARQVIERVRDGEIGKLEIVEIRSSGWDIINAGIHWLHLCIELLAPDRLVTVMARCDTSTRTYRDGSQVETVAVTYLESGHGVRIVMVTGDQVDMPDGGALAHFKLVGTRGVIDFHGFQEGYRLRSYDHQDGSQVEVAPASGTGHRLHLDGLADQIRMATLDYSLAERSLEALEACEAAYLSNRLGCLVRLPIGSFAPPPSNDWDPGARYSGSGGGRNGRNI